MKWLAWLLEDKPGPVGKLQLLLLPGKLMAYSFAMG